MSQGACWVRRVGIDVIDICHRLGSSLDMTFTRIVSTLRLDALFDGAYIFTSLTDGA